MKFIDFSDLSDKQQKEMYDDIAQKYGWLFIKDAECPMEQRGFIGEYGNFYDDSIRNRFAIYTALDIFFDNYGSEYMDIPDIVRQFVSLRRLRTNMGYTLNSYIVLGVDRNSRTVRFRDENCDKCYEISVEFLSDVFLSNILFAMLWMNRRDVLEDMKKYHKQLWYGH